MDEVFIIGLPKMIRSRLISEANRNGKRVSSVLADVGKLGTLTLVPHPSQTIFNLRSYIDRLNEISHACVVVLPYAQVPDDVEEELATLKDLGGTAITVMEGENGWPVLNCRRPNSEFSNALYNKLIKELFPENYRRPSEYFLHKSREHGRLIIPDGALVVCDQIPQHRWAFMGKAADAFSILIENNGRVGPLDVFFRNQGLDHAQTGGIRCSLEVYKNGHCIHTEASNVHLKQGDKTTPQSAVRVYYHALTLEEQYFVVILYAGPHPDTDVIRRWYIE